MSVFSLGEYSNNGEGSASFRGEFLRWPGGGGRVRARPIKHSIGVRVLVRPVPYTVNSFPQCVLRPGHQPHSRVVRVITTRLRTDRRTERGFFGLEASSWLVCARRKERNGTSERRRRRSKRPADCPSRFFGFREEAGRRTEEVLRRRFFLIFPLLSAWVFGEKFGKSQLRGRVATSSADSGDCGAEKRWKRRSFQVRSRFSLVKKIFPIFFLRSLGVWRRGRRNGAGSDRIGSV